jgi:glycosyltransferase involved in cell wall biosynthesis
MSNSPTTAKIRRADRFNSKVPDHAKDRILWEDDEPRTLAQETQVSIVIPSFGCADYIGQAVESLRDQSFRDIQIIIVDDCSPDASNDVILKHLIEDDRVHLVLNHENRGLFRSRTIGARFAQGSYITHLDADDFLDLDCYERIWGIIGEQQPDIIQFGMRRVNTDDEASGVHEISIPREPIYDSYVAMEQLLSSSLNFSLCNRLFKRSLWTSVQPKFSPENEKLEDLARIGLLILHSESYMSINKRFHNYRQTPGSDSLAGDFASKFDRATSAVRSLHGIKNEIISSPAYSSLVPVYYGFEAKIFEQYVTPIWGVELLEEHVEKFDALFDLLSTTIGFAAFHNSSVHEKEPVIDLIRERTGQNRSGRPSITAVFNLTLESLPYDITTCVESLLRLDLHKPEILLVADEEVLATKASALNSIIGDQCSVVDTFSMDEILNKSTGTYFLFCDKFPIFNLHLNKTLDDFFEARTVLPDIIDLGFSVNRAGNKKGICCNAIADSTGLAKAEKFFSHALWAETDNKLVSRSLLTRSLSDISIGRSADNLRLSVPDLLRHANLVARLPHDSFTLDDWYPGAFANDNASLDHVLDHGSASLGLVQALDARGHTGLHQKAVSNFIVPKISTLKSEWRSSPAELSSFTEKLSHAFGAKLAIHIISELNTSSAKGSHYVDPSRRRIDENISAMQRDLESLAKKLKATTEENRDRIYDANKRLGKLNERLGNHDDRFKTQGAQIADRISKLDDRIKTQGAQVDERFANHDERFKTQGAKIDEKLANHDERIKSQGTKIDERLANHDARIKAQGTQMSERISSHDERLRKLETRANEQVSKLEERLQTQVARLNERLGNHDERLKMQDTRLGNHDNRIKNLKQPSSVES